MPSTSKAQQRAMAAAEHGADFPLARKLRASMSREQLHEFASGSMKGKPEHAHAPRVKGARKIEVETHSFDWRQRSGLKRG